MSETSRAIRKAIVRAFHQEGLTYERIASMLGVGEATVSRILRLHRETGSVKRRPRGGGNFSPLCGEVARMLGLLVRSLPDATIEELTEKLRDRTGVQTSRSAVDRKLRQLGYSRKKSPSAPPSRTSRSTSPAAASSRPW
jgi:transposase